MNLDILQEMLDCYHAGDEKNNAMLNSLLLANDKERRAFLLELMDEDLISDELKLDQVSAIYSENNEASFNRPTMQGKRSKLYPLLTAAAIIVAVISLGVHFLPDTTEQMAKDDPLPQKSEVEANLPVARLIASTTDAEWIESVKADGELEKQQYQLISGGAHLEFSNGVELSMEAPVIFEIVDEFQILLYQGKMRAHVPESGYGFRVHTPDIDIKDLGTEFGVEVSSGVDTKVHVFNGEIELYPESNKEALLAVEGYASSWVEGVPHKQALAKESEFPSLKSIAYQRYQNFQQERLLDSSLHLFLDFKNGDNLIPSTVGEGLSASANQYVKLRGRWHQKSAYLLEQLEHGIRLPEIQIEGDYTIQAWIYPNSFQSSTSVIMNTKRFGKDRLHWQISRGGNIKSGIGRVKSRGDGVQRMVESGRWNQVTLTFNAERKVLKSYVNGQFVSRTIRPEKGLDLSETFIGSWNNTLYDGEARVLNGKMDEFAIWTRKLTSEEIAKSYKIGLPQ